MLSRANLKALREAKLEEPNKLRLAMTLAGVTQMQMSAELRVPQSQISRDVCGHYTTVSLEKARAYAAFFGCSVDDLYPAEMAVSA